MAIIFIATWLILLVSAIRLIRRGFQAASQYEATSEFTNRSIKEERRYVTKTTHPEMEDVEVGDELLIVRFDDQLEAPLYRALDDRITELEELEDEDDDGDIVVRV